jgi:hypothetical protein
LYHPKTRHSGESWNDGKSKGYKQHKFAVGPEFAQSLADPGSSDRPPLGEKGAGYSPASGVK